MSGVKREALKSKIARARIRECIALGMSNAQIVKTTGYSYAYVKLIAGQERVT